MYWFVHILLFSLHKSHILLKAVYIPILGFNFKIWTCWTITSTPPKPNSHIHQRNMFDVPYKHNDAILERFVNPKWWLILSRWWPSCAWSSPWCMWCGTGRTGHATGPSGPSSSPCLVGFRIQDSLHVYHPLHRSLHIPRHLHPRPCRCLPDLLHEEQWRWDYSSSSVVAAHVYTHRQLEALGREQWSEGLTEGVHHVRLLYLLLHHPLLHFLSDSFKLFLPRPQSGFWRRGRGAQCGAAPLPLTQVHPAHHGHLQPGGGGGHLHPILREASRKHHTLVGEWARD